MVGAIRKRDLLMHPVVTIRCFGWRLFWKAMFAGRGQTFLSVLAENESLAPPSPTPPQLVTRCIALEDRAKRIYERLAATFSGDEPLRRFFLGLARQEQHHGELLELCRDAAERGQWESRRFQPCAAAVPRQEEAMDGLELTAASTCERIEALRLVLRVEMSEINHLFRGVVAATESPFVRRVRAFQQAGWRHIVFVCRQVRRLEPTLAGECRRLRGSFPRAPAVRAATRPRATAS